MSITKKLTFKAGRTQKNLRRLTKWAGFVYDFSGNMHNSRYGGYKMNMPNGDMIIHLFERD